MKRKNGSRGRRSRKGTVIPMVALLSTVLIGMMAFSVDLGRLAMNRTQLQNAADASAMAGASKLATDNLLGTGGAVKQATDITAAQAEAQKFAQANTIDFKTKVVFNSPGDVDVGILSSPTDLSSTFLTSGSVPFNSVRTRTYADSSHSGAMPFLFAPVLGSRSAIISATATATVQVYTIASMKAVTGARSPILPITMSYSDWQQMVNGQTGVDSNSVDPTTGAVSSGSDGIQEQQLYPGSNGTSSNNGLLQFGTGSHSNSVLSDQIVNGPTDTQMIAQWPPSGVPPWNAQHQFTIGADPGWRASNFDALSQVISANQPRLIPLNDGTSPGNGANGSYTIVAFAAVRVVASTKGGKNNGSAWVQPALISDSSLTASSTVAGSGQGGIPLVRLTR